MWFSFILPLWWMVCYFGAAVTTPSIERNLFIIWDHCCVFVAVSLFSFFLLCGSLGHCHCVSHGSILIFLIRVRRGRYFFRDWRPGGNAHPVGVRAKYSRLRISSKETWMYLRADRLRNMMSKHTGSGSSTPMQVGLSLHPPRFLYACYHSVGRELKYNVLSYLIEFLEIDLLIAVRFDVVFEVRIYSLDNLLR